MHKSMNYLKIILSCKLFFVYAASRNTHFSLDKIFKRGIIILVSNVQPKGEVK